jgi:hypothetical protein
MEAEARRKTDAITSVIDEFILAMTKRPKAKGGMRSPRYIEETRRNFDNHVLPCWRDKDIKEITRRDVNELLDAIADKGTDVIAARDIHSRRQQGNCRPRWRQHLGRRPAR